MRAVRRLALAVGLWLLAAGAVLGQDCPLPASLKPVSPDKDIFSDQQESDLGDVMAENAAADFIIINDKALNAHLREVGKQITKYLPPNQFRFQFHLIDLPVPNAFSFSGGQIYVSRKIVALAHNDDEIAGLLAHELGHAITHQIAIRMTQRFREVLGVTKVGDRADIADKYQQLLDAWRRKPDKFSFGEEEANQEVADQISVYAAARAGYSPQGGVELLDRTLQTHGKTGSWLSDFFAVTTPEQRRLREMVKNMRSLPPGCAEPASTTRNEDFLKWQQQVIAYDINLHHKEVLPGVVFEQTLALPLRPDINNVRFSPDGKFVLAQDYGGIHVLSREQLSVLFFIEALDAHNATFTPDSKSIVFYTPNLRVETWDVASQKRTSAHELILRDPCVQSVLSPDGTVLGCLTHELGLTLFDVASSAELVSKKNFIDPGLDDSVAFWMLENALSEGLASLAHLSFSPDGRYFLAGTRRASFCFDLIQKHEVPLPSSVREVAEVQFAFVGADRLVGVNTFSPEKSWLVRFPSGERLQQIPLSNALHLRAATHGDYFLLGPLREKPLAIMDIQNKKIISLERETADMYDGVVLHEMDNGTVALTDMIAQKPGPKIQLQQTHLGGIRTVAVSDDFQWLAVSTRTRGAVWDLAHNLRVDYVRGFRGGWFSPEHVLFADFPKKDPQERMIGQFDALGQATAALVLKDQEGSQEGPYFALRKPEGDENKAKSWTVELRDIRTQATAWTRNFPRGIPRLSWDPSAGTVLMGHPIPSDFVQDELKQFPELKKKADSSDYFLELYDFRKNNLLGKLLVNTNKGSFAVHEARADGDWVVLEVSGGRALTYSLSSGEEVGHVFGLSPTLSAAAGLMAVSTVNGGEINIYELKDTKLREHFRFPTGIAYKKFSSDGKRLFVLTRDQTAYVLDLDAALAEAKVE